MWYWGGNNRSNKKSYFKLYFVGRSNRIFEEFSFDVREREIKDKCKVFFALNNWNNRMIIMTVGVGEEIKSVWGHVEFNMVTGIWENTPGWQFNTKI